MVLPSDKWGVFTFDSFISLLAAMGRIKTPECKFVLEYVPMQPLERLRGEEEMLANIAE